MVARNHCEIRYPRLKLYIKFDPNHANTQIFAVPCDIMGNFLKDPRLWLIK